MRAIVGASLVLALVMGIPPVSRADEQAEASKIVDRAVQAMGGKDKLGKFRAATVKATGTIQNIPITEESSTQWPDRSRFDLTLDIQGNKVSEIVVINADKGWIQLGGKTMDLEKDMATTFRDYLYALWLGVNPEHLQGKDFQLSPVGEIKVGERPAVGVMVKCKGRRDVNVYFDKETGLPAKAEINAPALEGGADVLHEMLFSDYKEFDGLKLYTKIVWNRDGKEYIKRELSEIKPSEKLEDGVFGKP